MSNQTDGSTDGSLSFTVAPREAVTPATLLEFLIGRQASCH